MTGARRAARGGGMAWPYTQTGTVTAIDTGDIASLPVEHATATLSIMKANFTPLLAK